jgi:hypothetical protein
MMVRELFSWIGVDPRDAASGFAGGVVRALIPPFLGPWISMSYVMIGCLTAAWLTDWMAVLFGGTNRGATGFLIGTMATVILSAIEKGMSNRMKKLGATDA